MHQPPKVLRLPVSAGAKPATEVLTSEQQTRCITTLCQELDDILGGGIAPGQLTEICESCSFCI